MQRKRKRGMDPIPCYEYSEKGKFIRKFSSVNEVRECYFPNDEGKRPIFIGKQHVEVEPGKKYVKTNKGTFIATYRIGREGLKQQERIRKSKFCNFEKNGDNKAIVCMNLKNQIIGRFPNMKIASILLKIPKSTISFSLKNEAESELRFRYEDSLNIN